MIEPEKEIRGMGEEGMGKMWMGDKNKEELCEPLR